MFWSLVAAVFLQALMGTTLKELAGEIAALLAASVYLSFSSLKNGLWTRKYTPTRKTNAVASMFPSVLFGGIHALRAFVILKKPIEFRTMIPTAVMCVGVYLLCFALLEAFRWIYKKRRRTLDDIDDAQEGGHNVL